MIKNKVVLISGGGGLIGSGIVKKVIEHEGKVVAIDKNKKMIDKLKSEFSNKDCLAILADTNNIDEIDLCIKKTTNQFGKLDVAIHAAYPKSPGWGTKFEKLKKDFLNEDLNQQLGGAILLVFHKI